MTTEATQDDVKNQANAQDEFNAEDLFNEIVSGKDSTPVDSSNGEDSLGHHVDDDNDSNAELDGEQPASKQASQDDDENHPDNDDGQSPLNSGGEGDSSDDENPAEDLWANATEAQRQAYLSLQHERHQLQNDVKANAGRVQGYARKVNELEAELNTLRQQVQQRPAQSTAGGNNDFQLEGKSLQEIEEDYPEIAQYVRHQGQQLLSQFQQQMQPIQQTTQQLSRYQQQLAERDQQEQVNAELRRLYEAHPDYTEIRENPAFVEWLRSKPESIRNLANSMSADDNIELLSIYKSQAQPQQPPQQPPQPNRRRDLSEHAEIPRKGVAPQPGLPEDPEELFDLIVSQKTY